MKFFDNNPEKDRKLRLYINVQEEIALRKDKEMKNNTFQKTVVINRAVPGSGKTSITRCIMQALSEANVSCAVHSTDEFFMEDGRYCFDIRKLNHYHQQNLKNFQSDVASGVDVVICDNTNLLPWQAAPYTESARQAGYQIIFINMTPRALADHVRSQMVTPEKPDAHEVPESCLKAFIRDFNNYNSLLLKGSDVAPFQHHFFWDEESLQPVENGSACHFDSDHVLTIKHTEYQEAKKIIGQQILRLLYKKSNIF